MAASTLIAAPHDMRIGNNNSHNSSHPTQTRTPNVNTQRTQTNPDSTASPASRGSRSVTRSDALEVEEARLNLHHTNPVIEAGLLRAKDEFHVQNLYQIAQAKAGIWNSEIAPEHEGDWSCNCPTHEYKRAKWNRRDVQKKWSEAVKYPGEKIYNDLFDNQSLPFFSENPYAKIPSPYGIVLAGRELFVIVPRAKPSDHAQFLKKTIALNIRLNEEAQAKVDVMEPRTNIWTTSEGQSGTTANGPPSSDDDYVWTVIGDQKVRMLDAADFSQSMPGSTPHSSSAPSDLNPKRTPGSGFRKLLGLKTSEEKALHKAKKLAVDPNTLRAAIVAEENGRWPTQEMRLIVTTYQRNAGIWRKMRATRMYQPLQCLHLLRAGYFEPIPLSWATMNGSPLKFTIDGGTGYWGITPQWRGYETTAEERLYWVLNHREDPGGRPVEKHLRIKPDFTCTMAMAKERMARAVAPPPEYYSGDDICAQEGGGGTMGRVYSTQVTPTPFRTYDRQQVSTDTTMILLDASGSMDYQVQRPVYEQYLITRWEDCAQPKNKDLVRAILRRFMTAMINRDGSNTGYDLITFSSTARHIGKISPSNFVQKWDSIRFGKNTRVMQGWQKVKDLHFRRHQDTATYDPVFGWQAGPTTPMLRLLLLLDGEANDMDEFELDLLGLDWAHVTIFLVGADECPHHHRHANELQRISEVNPHVSFVDAQGNIPERFVTHELLKRHLGYDISMEEFQAMEVLLE